VNNKEWEVEEYSGDPVLMSSEEYEQDPELLVELEGFSEKVNEYSKLKVGHANKPVDGKRQNCRSKECELGNVVADSFLESFRKHDKNVLCTLLSSGSVRSSIDEGEITYEDLLTVLPWGNTVDKATIPGSVLREVFEHSVSTLNATGYNVGDQGRYLQTAGVKVYYDLTKDVGNRVAKLLIQTPSGEEYEEVDDDKTYDCVGPGYLMNGGDGFAMLEHLEDVDAGGEVDVEVLKTFIGEHDPLDEYPGIKDIPSRSFFTKAV